MLASIGEEIYQFRQFPVDSLVDGKVYDAPA